jgi:hypothetical protein
VHLLEGFEHTFVVAAITPQRQGFPRLGCLQDRIAQLPDCATPAHTNLLRSNLVLGFEEVRMREVSVGGQRTAENLPGGIDGSRRSLGWRDFWKGVDGGGGFGRDQTWRKRTPSAQRARTVAAEMNVGEEAVHCRQRVVLLSKTMPKDAANVRKAGCRQRRSSDAAPGHAVLSREIEQQKEGRTPANSRRLAAPILNRFLGQIFGRTAVALRGRLSYCRLASGARNAKWLCALSTLPHHLMFPAHQPYGYCGVSVACPFLMALLQDTRKNGRKRYELLHSNTE